METNKINTWILTGNTPVIMSLVGPSLWELDKEYFELKCIGKETSVDYPHQESCHLIIDENLACYSLVIVFHVLIWAYRRIFKESPYNINYIDCH